MAHRYDHRPASTPPAPKGLSIAVWPGKVEPIRIDHEGEELIIYVKRDPLTRGRIRVVFDGPRSFRVRRRELVERDEEGRA